MKKIIFIFAFLAILLGSANAADTLRLNTLCETNIWSAQCNIGTPIAKFNYTGGCTTLNTTVWCANVTGASTNYLPYGTNISIANDTAAGITLNASLTNTDYWSCKINTTCGSIVTESATRVIFMVGSGGVTLLGAASSRSITNSSITLTFSVNATSTYRDTVWVNGSGNSSNQLELTCNSLNVCTGTANMEFFGSGAEASYTIDVNANDTAGTTNVTGVTIVVNNTAPVVATHLTTDDADGIFQFNESKNWTLDLVGDDISSVTINDYLLRNSTVDASIWFIDNLSTLSLVPSCSNNCTYCSVTATITDTAGNVITSTNESLTIFPCIESTSGWDTLNVTGVATKDTLTLTYAGSGNSSTLVYMPLQNYNVSHGSCYYEGTNVNRTEVNVGPLNTTLSFFCNVTEFRGSTDTGTSEVASKTRLDPNPPNDMLGTGIVGLLIIVTAIISRSKKTESAGE